MLLLDSEALSAIAQGPAERRDRVRALITEMRRRERVEVRPVDTRVGVRAGQLLGAIRCGSEPAVGAFLVAAGDLAGGAVVATVDLTDLRRLAEHATAVLIVPV